MKILVYEIRKNFAKRYLLIILCLLTAVNIFSIYDYYRENRVFAVRMDGQYVKAYWDLYEGKFKGEITMDKINELMEIYTPLYRQIRVERAYSTDYDPDTYTGYVFGDYTLLDHGFVRHMEYSYLYRKHAAEITEAAKENLAFFRSRGSVYPCRVNARIASLFAGRRIPDFYSTEMFDNLFRYNFSSFLVLLMSIPALVPVFVADKETEMDQILSVSKKGGKDTVNAKIRSSFLFVIGIGIWFYLVDFFTFSYFYGLTGLSYRLYALGDFMLTPLDLRMWQYILLSDGVKLVGLLAFSSVILFFSSLFRRTRMPYMLSLASVFLLLLWKESGWGGKNAVWRLFNPMEILENKELFQNTAFFNVLGYPVHECLGVILSVMLLAAIFIRATKCMGGGNAWLGKRMGRGTK